MFRPGDKVVVYFSNRPPLEGELVEFIDSQDNLIILDVKNNPIRDKPTYFLIRNFDYMEKRSD